MGFRKKQKLVLQWAKDRDLLHYKNRFAQLEKVQEEVDELKEAIKNNDEPGIVDGFGDALVTFIILAEQLDYDLVKCLGSAYKEIKDRKGKTVNGTFIKE